MLMAYVDPSQSSPENSLFDGAVIATAHCTCKAG